MKMKETIATIGEGITEYFYMQSVLDCVKIKPKPITPKNSSLAELENCIKDCIRMGYSKVFCLIDMDNKANDGIKEHEANRKKYLELKRKYHQKEHKHQGGKTWVFMLESYPCTEMFFYYYKKYSTGTYTNSGLKKILNEWVGYEATVKFLGKNPLHNLLCRKGGSLAEAIENSKKSVKERDAENVSAGYSEMGFLFDYLVIK